MYVCRCARVCTPLYISSTDYEYECRCIRVQFRLDRNWATSMRRANTNARRASRDCALQRFSIIHVHSFPLSLNARSPATGGTPCRTLTSFPCDRDRRPWLTSRVQYPSSLSSRYPSSRTSSIIPDFYSWPRYKPSVRFLCDRILQYGRN